MFLTEEPGNILKNVGKLIISARPLLLSTDTEYPIPVISSILCSIFYASYSISGGN